MKTESNIIPDSFYKEAWILADDLSRAKSKKKFVNTLFSGLSKILSSDNCFKIAFKPKTFIPIKSGSLFWKTEGKFDPVSKYVDYFYKVDPFHAPVEEFLLSGERSIALHIEDTISRRHLKKTEFFLDFLKPMNISSIMILGINSPIRQPSITFGVSRGLESRSYSDLEMYMLEFLAPHIADAWNKCDFRELFSSIDSSRYKEADDLENNVPLTPREIEIATHVAFGFDNKEIGDELQISSITVRDHLRAIFRKWHINSRSQLVAKMLIGELKL